MALSDVMNAFTFGSGKTQAEQQPSPNPTPGNIPDGKGTNNIPPQGTENNNNNNTDGNNNNEQTPLDPFKDLWKNDDKSTTENNFGILGEINPQKIAEVAGKVNFAKAVKADDVKAIQAGGDGAVEALGRALNSVSQTVYAQSAVAASKLIEAATEKLEAKLNESLPSRIKQQSFSNNLREQNPAYSHPAAAPLVAMIEQQMSSKYPNATPAELTTLAQDYFTKTFSAISGADKKKAEEEAKAKAGEFDWEADFLSSNN